THLPLHERGRRARHALRDAARLVPGPAGDGLARCHGTTAQDAREQEPRADPERDAAGPTPVSDSADHLAQERVDGAVDVAREAAVTAVDPRHGPRQALQAREDLEQLPAGG